MPEKQLPSVCLAMIVRDESSIIERALYSVKPFVDHWVIHDMGSTDDTIERIHRVMADIPGSLEQHTLSNFSVARNNLLSSAQMNADFVLMLDADEELQTLNNALDLSDFPEIGIVDISQAEHVIRQPRLFARSTTPSFQYSAGEQFTSESFSIEQVPGVTIKHHADGIRHRESIDPIAERHTIKSITDGPINDPALLLNLAKHELSHNRLTSALRWLSSVTQNHLPSKEYWLASYLAGNIHLSNGNTDEALVLFERCFDSNPERAEPLMRLAEIHAMHGDNSTAQQLAELVLDMSISAKADYYEPRIYAEGARMLLLKIAYSSENQTAISDHLAALNKISKLSSSAQAKVNEIKAKIQQSGSEPSTSQSIETEQIIERPVLTIGMATFDDFDGVYFSIMSIVLYHRTQLKNLEIVVVDNNSGSAHGAAVKSLCERVQQARYIAADEYKGTAVRERIFAEARGELVLCIDCHVFLHSGAIEKLIEYHKLNLNSRNLLHGPLYYDNHESYSTHMDAEWSDGFYGRWGTDERGGKLDGAPFEIPLQGMGMFACNKQHWLGFNHRFRGFGGEEGYIHEKFRQHGGRVLCIPFLRWTHRFDRPAGTSYVNRWEDRIRNYLIGWNELGLDAKPILEHFTQHLSFDVAASCNASFLLEFKSKLWKYDTIYCLCNDDSQWQPALDQWHLLAADKVVQRVNDTAHLAQLLRTSDSRNLDSVLVTDCRISSMEDLSCSLDRVLEYDNTHTNDLISHCGKIEKVKDAGNTSPHESFGVILLKSKAFIPVAECLESDGNIRLTSIKKLDQVSL